MTQDEIFSGIQEGLREAIAHARGEIALETRVVKPNPDIIVQIRKSAARSRPDFEAKYGVPVRTLQDWEQGRRSPDLTARAYLACIAADPAGMATIYAKAKGEPS